LHKVYYSSKPSISWLARTLFVACQNQNDFYITWIITIIKTVNFYQTRQESPLKKPQVAPVIILNLALPQPSSYKHAQWRRPHSRLHQYQLI
jgi:hypothetical protein